MQSTHHRGFTVIELLVSALIISILAALLLLTLRNAMESRRRTQCVNNLHQIALATTLYADDNHGRFPMAGATTLLLPYVGHGAPLLGPEDTHHVFYCPASTGKPVVSNYALGDLGGAYLDGGQGLKSYGYNRHLQDAFDPNNSLWASDQGVRTIGEIKSPSHVFWAFDCMNEYASTYDWGAIPGFRHGGKYPGFATKEGGAGFNESFLDGHVEWISWPKFQAWETALEPPRQPFSWGLPGD